MRAEQFAKKGKQMKSRFVTALALSIALAGASIAPAAAEPAFRSAEPQTFTAQDLGRYGLDATAAERAVALQDNGYQLMVLSEEEAEQYTAGITDNQWLLVGILIGVVVIAVSVSD